MQNAPRGFRQGNNFHGADRQASFALTQFDPCIDFEDFLRPLELGNGDRHEAFGHHRIDVFGGEPGTEAIHPNHNGHAALLRASNAVAYDSAGRLFFRDRHGIFEVDNQGIRVVLGRFINPVRAVARNKKYRAVLFHISSFENLGGFCHQSLRR
jgi:hypothetical protein